MVPYSGEQQYSVVDNLNNYKQIKSLRLPQLRVAALNSAQSGNMGGINAANYACYREVRH